MYTFKFVYKNSDSVVVSDVESVSYKNHSGTETRTVSTEQISSYEFPLNRPLNLFTLDGTASITNSDLKAIIVTQQ